MIRWKGGNNHEYFFEEKLITQLAHMTALDLVKKFKIPLSKIKTILGIDGLKPTDEISDEQCNEIEVFLKNIVFYPRIKKTKKSKKKKKPNPLNPNGYIYPKSKFISTGM